VVEAKGVRKGFGDRTLIEDLTFSLPPGGIVGIVGPNGAGKTTLIRMLMGEQQPDEGELIIGEGPPLHMALTLPEPKPSPRPTLTPIMNLAPTPNPHPHPHPNQARAST
tara:strand:+ start:472 stop:798 length:327 start_codon:yes stop_codon:yes gene_type:complete